MLVIGIAGPPAGGKSTVAARLKELGAVWLNADELAHQVLNRPAIQQVLADRFGSDVVVAKQIDRAKVARHVFGADPQSKRQLEWLESVIHPPTRELLEDQLIEAARQCRPATLLDVPLLFESGWDVYCDRIWCLDVSFEHRVDRVRARGWTGDELRQRESRQLLLSEKKRLSTDILTNDGTPQELLSLVDRLWQVQRSKEILTIDEHCLGSARTPAGKRGR